MTHHAKDFTVDAPWAVLAWFLPKDYIPTGGSRTNGHLVTTRWKRLAKADGAGRGGKVPVDPAIALDLTGSELNTDAFFVRSLSVGSSGGRCAG